MVEEKKVRERIQEIAQNLEKDVWATWYAVKNLFNKNASLEKNIERMKKKLVEAYDDVGLEDVGLEAFEETEYTFEDAKRDIINSPFSEELGWTEDGELTEAGKAVAEQAEDIGLADTFEDAKRDIINSPFSEELGWTEDGELTEAGKAVAEQAEGKPGFIEQEAGSVSGKTKTEKFYDVVKKRGEYPYEAPELEDAEVVEMWSGDKARKVASILRPEAIETGGVNHLTIWDNAAVTMNYEPYPKLWLDTEQQVKEKVKEIAGKLGSTREEPLKEFEEEVMERPPPGATKEELESTETIPTYTWKEAIEKIPELKYWEPQEQYKNKKYPLETWKEYYADIVEEHEAQSPSEAVLSAKDVSGSLERENHSSNPPARIRMLEDYETKERDFYKEGDIIEIEDPEIAEEIVSVARVGEFVGVEDAREKLDSILSGWQVTSNPSERKILARIRKGTDRLGLSKENLEKIGDWQEKHGMELTGWGTQRKDEYIEMIGKFEMRD